MKIVHGWPPNLGQILAVFPGLPRGVIFTYGDEVYIPEGGFLTRELVAHEGVHVAQQARYEGGPAAWWTMYLADTRFRLEQELEAHRAEYREFLKEDPPPSRPRRRRLLKLVARRLAGPLYGNLVTLEQAKELIAHG